MSEPIRIAAWTNEHNRGFIGGHYIRPFGPYPKGTVHDGHAHYIDHMNFIEAGVVSIKWRIPLQWSDWYERESQMLPGRTVKVRDVLVWSPRQEFIIEAPNFITIKAEAEHQFEALVDGTRWRCIFSEAEAAKLEGADGAIPFNMGKPNV